MNVSLFPKLWKFPTIDSLGSFLQSLGVSFVELPIRDGYFVTEKNMYKTFVPAVLQLRKMGIKVHAASWNPSKLPTRQFIELCAQAKVSTIRVMAKIDMKLGYLKSVSKMQKNIEKIVPFLEANKVKLGVQNHAEYWVGSALGLHHLLHVFSPKVCGAILDFAHCSLDGEPIDMAWDILQKYIIHVNFKSACYHNYGNETNIKWKQIWVEQSKSLYSWKDAVALLKKKKYNKPIVLFAEYTKYVNGKKVEIIGNEATKLVIKDIKALSKYIK